MLSKDYSQLFFRNVDEFAVNILSKKNVTNYEDRYTLFYPVIGKHYETSNNLLVIGQATNGWQPVFSLMDVHKILPDIVKQSIDYSSAEDGKCSLEWINESWSDKEYNLFRSFFWNITYKLSKKFFGRTDENWNNVIAWSNLMKIAPAGGGNPDWDEREAQRFCSFKLFTKEIDDLRPKNVLIMTNLEQWAKPILNDAGISYKEVEGRFVEAIATYSQSKIIVTKRGFLKVTHEEAINEVIQYFNSDFDTI